MFLLLVQRSFTFTHSEGLVTKLHYESHYESKQSNLSHDAKGSIASRYLSFVTNLSYCSQFQLFRSHFHKSCCHCSNFSFVKMLKNIDERLRQFKLELAMC